MHRIIRDVFATSFLCAAASALALSACDDNSDGGSTLEVHPALLTPAELGLGDDWTEQEPGLWSRLNADGQEQFVGVGEPGKLHGLASLREVEERLALRAEADPSDEARAQLDEIRGLIGEIESFAVKTPTEDPALRCTLSLNHLAIANPASCGVQANASATYSYPCSTATENVFTYTEATCGVLTTTHSCGWKTGNPVGCGSHSSITGVAPCSSYAYSASSNYATWMNNSVRGYCEPPVEPPVCSCQAGYDCHCGDGQCVPKNQMCN